ncbi:MAG: hypothetical protein HYU04_01225 [Candidatus Wildermuthbacteria bacterium]|nr:hypothetical protein [Candidatus Wildermuthbacteria bacterium]
MKRKGAVPLPPPEMFMGTDYPRRFTWETWVRRVEREWLMVARSIEAVIWATVGVLLGVALAAIPGRFLVNYQYVIWLPLGAAVGAAVGAILVWRRWRRVFED